MGKEGTRSLRSTRWIYSKYEAHRVESTETMSSTENEIEKQMTNSQSMTVENGLDLVLLVLYEMEQIFNNAPLKGSTRLQKLLFLLWKEGKFAELAPDLYNFKAYDFGPCLEDLYDDLDFAESIELIQTADTFFNDAFDDADSRAFMNQFIKLAKQGKKRRDYSLTSQGRVAARDLWKSLNNRQQDSLNQIVVQFGEMPIRQLLQYVYANYPKFAEKSKIADSL